MVLPPATSTRTPILDFSSLSHYDWLDVPMWVFDPERQRNLWANAAALSFWQAETAEEFLSRDHSDTSAAVRQRLTVTAEELAQGRIVREQWTLYPKGSPVTVMLVSRGIRTPDRKLVMLFAADSLSSGSDKSMLRGVEALQHTPVRIAIFSLRDGSLLMKNPAAAMCFGSIMKSRPGTDFEAIFQTPDVARRIFSQIQKGQTFASDLELNTAIGPRWHSLDARPMRDPVTGDLVLQFNARDIADLKATQLALEQAREAAEAASRAKSGFLANMSHEIRTPMNGVLSLTELVLQTELNDRQRKFIELAHGSAKSLMVIINDLLDVAKIEAGRVVIEHQPFALQDCVQEAVQALAQQAQNKGIALHTSLPEGRADTLLGDALRLRQVLINLVGNAIKFTEHGEVRLCVRVVACDALLPDGSEALRLQFDVSDTGIGMTPEQLSQIFAPFSQADHSITRRFGGTGLGLTIVQRLVQLMGGTVRVQSEAGQGSVFSFDALVGRQVPATGSAAAVPAAMASDQQDA